MLSRGPLSLRSQRIVRSTTLEANTRKSVLIHSKSCVVWSVIVRANASGVRPTLAVGGDQLGNRTLSEIDTLGITTRLKGWFHNRRYDATNNIYVAVLEDEDGIDAPEGYDLVVENPTGSSVTISEAEVIRSVEAKIENEEDQGDGEG